MTNIRAKSWTFAEPDNSNTTDKTEDCGEFGVSKLVKTVLSGQSESQNALLKHSFKGDIFVCYLRMCHKWEKS